MTITMLSSREFNQDTGGAKKAAARGPVVITDRGRPAHVLLTFERYQQLTGSSADIVELLSDAEAAQLDFDPPRIGTTDPLYRPADFS